MKDFFPASLGKKGGRPLHVGAHYTWQNMVNKLYKENFRT